MKFQRFARRARTNLGKSAGKMMEIKKYGGSEEFMLYMHYTVRYMGDVHRSQPV